MRWSIGVLGLVGCLRGDAITPTTPSPTNDECAPGWFLDADGDGFGNRKEPRCPADPSVADNDLDCDDGDAGVSPAREEICTLGPPRDEDCDPITPEPVAVVGTTFYTNLGNAIRAADGTMPVQVCPGVHGVETTAIVGAVSITSLAGDPSSAELTGVDGPLFRIESDDADLTLHAIRVTGGDGMAGGVVQGGALAFGLLGTVRLDDVTATGNHAGAGGVVTAREVIAVNSRFDGNTATTVGGSIAAVSIQVDGCEFTNGSAESGGALFAAGPLTSANSDYNGLSASGKGGAIVADGRLQSELDTFSLCSAGQGGAVEIHASSSFDDTLFTNNSALQGGALSAVMASPNASLSLLETRFLRNTATRAGGAASLSGISMVDATDAQFNNNLSNDAQARGDAGAVLLDASGLAEVVWIGGVFEGNEATGGGGAVAVDCDGLGRSVKLEAVDLRSNEALRGGGLFVRTPCRVDLVDVDIAKNQATLNGGGVQVDSRATLNATDTTFLENNASRGSALFLGMSSRVELSTTKVNQNLPGESAAIHLTEDSELILKRADLGVGSTDNGTGADIAGGGVVGPPNWVKDLGNDVTTVCEFDGCASAP